MSNFVYQNITIYFKAFKISAHIVQHNHHSKTDLISHTKNKKAKRNTKNVDIKLIKLHGVCIKSKYFEKHCRRY